MKKIFSIATSMLIFGIILIGSGTVGYSKVTSARYEINGYTIESNASFLTPVPINYTIGVHLLPHEKMAVHRISTIYYLLRD